MRRRKNNEGHYGEKTIKGVVYKYYRFPGMGAEVYAKTAKELEEKKKKKERELLEKEETKNPKKMTLYAVCTQWLKSVHGKISPRTYDDYESIIENRIKSLEFGNLQACSITINDVTAYLARMSKKYSKASIDKTWAVLKQAIAYGLDEEIISGNFDFRKVTKPREQDVAIKKREIQCIDPADMELLFKECYRVNGLGTPYYGRGSKVIVFIMYSGTRISEAMGLQWKYVAKDLSSVKIRQSLSRIVERDNDGNAITEGRHKKSKTIMKETKTASGERDIPLPDRAIEVLKYFHELYPNHGPDDLVFRTDKGTPYSKTNLNHTLDTILKNSSCTCKEYTPHSLRHGYGSVLLSEGVYIKVVSKLLGHKDIQTTYDIYIHVLKNDDKEAVLRVFNKNAKH